MFLLRLTITSLIKLRDRLSDSDSGSWVLICFWSALLSIYIAPDGPSFVSFRLLDPGLWQSISLYIPYAWLVSFFLIFLTLSIPSTRLLYFSLCVPSRTGPTQICLIAKCLPSYYCACTNLHLIYPCLDVVYTYQRKLCYGPSSVIISIRGFAEFDYIILSNYLACNVQA